MATTYQDVYNAIHANASLRDQVYVACLNAAKTVFGEAGTTDDHANRLTWATSVVTNVDAATDRMLLAVALDSDVQTALPTPGDSTVQTAVNGLINFFADSGL